MRYQLARVITLASAAMGVSACGGGGGGATAAFIPPPPTTPPSSTLPIPPAHLGLTSAAPFAVLSIGEPYTTDSAGNNPTPSGPPSAQNVQFGYSAATNTYQISLPGFQSGTLADTGYNGSAGQPATSSGSHVTAGSSSSLQSAFVSLFVPGNAFSPYTYTSFGSWGGQTGVNADGRIAREQGEFAYGIPTAAGEMPTVGSASYSAQIRGTTGVGVNAFFVSGTANLAFDFGGGTLSGSMHPGVFDDFDGIIMDFGRYDFKQTVYSTGSPTFSGKFIVPGLPNADSSFDGNFTGPNAAELMARFQAPYLFNGQQGTVSGVWIGKKN
jgi:hypothetical protein